MRGKNFSIVRSMPILKIKCQHELLPTWLRAMNMTFADVKSGARYDHNCLALPVDIRENAFWWRPKLLSAISCAEAFCTWYRDHGRVAACNIAPMRSIAVTILKSLGPFCTWLVCLCKKGRPPRSRLTSREQPAPLK